MKKIAILGSTGSIGVTSCDVIRKHRDDFSITLLSANKNFKKLAEQANEFKPAILCIGERELVDPLRSLLNYDAKVFYGTAGLIESVKACGAELLLNSLVGSVGLLPTLEAINLSMDIALANKETLVVGGELVTSTAKKRNVKLIPVDSEHNAIFQCLYGNSNRPLKRIILTASGGPLLRTSLDEFEKVTPKQALNHPTWGMGKKISIDSATMMNKGLEIIEARWLFDLPIDMIDVLIHPQSIVHGMAEFTDGSVISMLGPTSMSIPIIYSMYYPEHAPSAPVEALDMAKGLNLEFFAPDEKRFPLLAVAKKTAKELGTAPTVLNASNEVAVQAFLDGRIKFTEIRDVIEASLSSHRSIKADDINVLVEVDAWARRYSEEFINKRGR